MANSRVIGASVASAIPVEAIDGKITLVYWDICGLAQPIRLALACAGVEFVDVRIDAGHPPSDSYKQVWFDRKPDVAAAGCLFTNLPYLIDGNLKIAQSNAILLHVGRKFNLLGDNPVGVDLALAQGTDLDNALTGTCYREAFNLEPLLQSRLKLDEWAAMLGAKPFMTGDTLTVADLKIYETFRKIKIAAGHCNLTSPFDKHPTLSAFIDRVEAHPPVAAYQKSPAYRARPLNNPHAQFR
ncbi:hypothetical protein CTAYLR_000955 [Chrysophaeum taylorii]|uniref:glutathione transferase n=1 Tax=Chrysophaeum taylorii TaxID=2483200 RepID=A0AAD7XQ13_9STRA|nr:hypothetical protein CTAYLR_000955 [Chrysophaeum taylorii]